MTSILLKKAMIKQKYSYLIKKYKKMYILFKQILFFIIHIINSK